MPSLGNEVAALTVVSPLVLQPRAVSFNTTNLLTIVVWNGVGDGVGRRINTVLADAIEEFLLFL